MLSDSASVRQGISQVWCLKLLCWLGAILGLLITARSLPAQSFITGTIWEKNADRKLSLVGVWVVGSLLPDGEVIAQAKTGSNGVYRLEGLPASRLEIHARHPGYYTVLVDGREAEQAVLECPAAGECATVDFLLAPAGIVEGFISDPYSEPLSWVRVSLVPEGESPGPERGLLGPLERHTDDQGYFRITGVRPGRYRLHSRYRGRVPALESEYTAEPADIVVTEGQALPPVRILMQAAVKTFTLSGRLQRIEFPPGQTPVIMATPVRGPEYLPRPWFSQIIQREDGSFVLSGLPEGEYEVAVGLLNLASGMERTRMRLETILVDRDMPDLLLEPRPPTGISGRVLFESAPAQNVILDVVPRNQAINRSYLVAEAPDYSFEKNDLRPGEYTLKPRGDSLYVKSPRRISVAEGHVETIEIILSSEFARIDGRVQDSPGDVRRAPGAGRPMDFVVAIRGEDGVRTQRTDQNGGFAFDQVVPGKYQVCAWAEPGVQPEDDAAWKQAGAAVRSFEVQEGDRVELVLSAAK